MVEFKISSFCSLGNCIEVGPAADGSVVVVRRGEDVNQVLVCTRDEWAAFVKGVKAGEFDFG